MKVTVSKLQIKQAEEEATRLYTCGRLLWMAIETLDYAKMEGHYNKLPEEVKRRISGDIKLCKSDLEVLRKYVSELSEKKANRAKQLKKTREEQLSSE